MNTHTVNQSTPEAGSQRPRRASTLAALTLAGLGFTLASPAAALLCDNVFPNDIEGLGENQHGFTSTSNNGGYASVGCNNYVVDIWVPSNSSGTGHDIKSFYITTTPIPGPGGGPDPVKCAQITGRTIVYKGALGSNALQQIARWEVEGVWTPGELFPCSIRVRPNSQLLPPILNPPASSMVFYRVVTIQKNGSSPTAVSVNAYHHTVPH